MYVLCPYAIKHFKMDSQKQKILNETPMHTR